MNKKFKKTLLKIIAFECVWLLGTVLFIGLLTGAETLAQVAFS